MSPAGRPWIAAALGFLAIGCSALPEIEHGTCGNRVIEPGESCDGFPEGEARCRAPGEPLACQLDCSQRADGTRPACPPNWGCAGDNVCRPATGAYRASSAPVVGDAFALLTGDFDGDGRGDVVSMGAPGALEAAKFRVHYFDREGELERTWTSPRILTSVVIDDVSADAASDMVFTDGRMGVLLGQISGEMISATYPTYFLPSTKLRMVGDLYPENVDDILALLVLAETEEDFVLYRPDFSSESLLPIAQLDGGIAELAGEPVTADVFEDDLRYPCTELAFAMRGAHALALYSACERDPVTHQVHWRGAPEVNEVRLVPEAGIERGPLFADMNADGHLDLLVGASGQLYVAFGDGRRLGDAEPLFGDVDEEQDLPLEMPIAAGDFSGDGAADLVYPSGFLVSRAPGTSERPRYATAFGRATGLWTEARIVDLNGNGFPDVVAASNRTLDIDFFNGTGDGRLGAAVLPTTRPVEHLAVGDLDGDLIQDLAYTLVGEGDEARAVAVAFGSASGPPARGVPVAAAAGIQQIDILLNPTPDALGQLFVGYEQMDERGQMGSSLAWLLGSGDRSLACAIELTSFASDGSLEAVPSIALTTGAFTDSARRDAVAIGSRQPGDFGLWLVPDLRSRRGRPVVLRSELGARVAPFSGLGRGEEPRVEISMAAGDLDHDGRDELVIMAPDPEFERCSITSARVVERNGFALEAKAQVTLDEPCVRGAKPLLRDLDGDLSADLVFLLGPAGPSRSAVVLWNDGKGRFSADERTTLVAAAHAPQAFTLFRPTPNAQVALAYVSEHEVHVVRSGEQPRTFVDTKLAIELDRGTGIAATDVDGDGIADLLLADRGSVRVLRAELAP